ncbi:hypothetical protein M4V62_14220 [Streptomyces durmitorensis]|uniref:Uncharacterized protein n=1 Tax=Streptomyces durmitorensis TaxID=319947 RepID=A0ABY4PTA7_9ACTN|nr:hypothetical protein [Streptomyces durmitorensis]UQT56158.1 hypothetical protein M4V62_14220 [Streptomyces durmitorensis]
MTTPHPHQTGAPVDLALVDNAVHRAEGLAVAPWGTPRGPESSGCGAAVDTWGWWATTETVRASI